MAFFFAVASQMRDHMGSLSEADSESNMSSFRESLINGSGDGVDYSPLRSADDSPVVLVSLTYSCTNGANAHCGLDQIEMSFSFGWFKTFHWTIFPII